MALKSSRIILLIHLIRATALRYGVDPELAIVICRRESSYDEFAIGDNGLAVGLWQWHLTSWEHVRAKMGKDTLDRRTDLVESTEAAMYAMGELGLYEWWSTYHPALRELGLE